MCRASVAERHDDSLPYLYCVAAQRYGHGLALFHWACIFYVDIERMYNLPPLSSFAVAEDRFVREHSNSGDAPEVLGSPYLFGRHADWHPRSPSRDRWRALVITACRAFDTEENP